MATRRVTLASPLRLLVALAVAATAVGSLPTRAGGAIVPTEICDNCFDDDGNTKTDREDTPACKAPADGNNLGVGDESEAKAVLKCQKAIEKVSAKYVVKKLGVLDKCVDAEFACLQLKNGDPACTTKVQTACAKQISALEDGVQGALLDPIDKVCDASQGTGPSLADVLAATGLGYMAEESLPGCDADFQSFDQVALCILHRHDCGAERVLVAAAPRAGEVLTSLGRVVATEFPCIASAVDGADGGGAGLAGDAKEKAAVKCQAAITKAGVKLGKLAFSIFSKCSDAAGACIQKPDAAARDACVQKAGPKCQASITKAVGAKGPVLKLLLATSGKCETPDLTFSDLQATGGLGFSAATSRCGQFTLQPIGDATAMLMECVAFQYGCEGLQLAEREAPRFREYATLLGVQLPQGL